MRKHNLFIITILFTLALFFSVKLGAEETSCLTSSHSPFYPIKEFQSPVGVYFNFTLGPGFLYFKNIKGNLTPVPAASFPSYQGAFFKNLDHFSYNKTVLYEAAINKRILPWIQTGVCFYGQSGVNVQAYSPCSTTSAGNPTWGMFSSDLQLYGLMLKTFLENPYPILIKRCVMNIYLGLGVGAGWQSWTNNLVYETIVLNNNATTTQLALNNKFSANAMWTMDAGLSFQPATNQPTLQVKLGCKYTDWGQMRQIGTLKDQSVKVAPFKPISAKKVYSFSPYIGVQWSF